jgi:hypothetical protein
MLSEVHNSPAGFDSFCGGQGKLTGFNRVHKISGFSALMIYKMVQIEDGSENQHAYQLR